MIAVTGATGQLGHLVISELKSRVPSSEIVALARTPAKAADLGISMPILPRSAWRRITWPPSAP